MENQNQLTLTGKFLIYHGENPHVYAKFKEYAYLMISKGRTRLSGRLIYERIRWYAQFETVGDDFKVNNNYIAFYSRLFMRENPQYDGYFSTRVQTAALR